MKKKTILTTLVVLLLSFSSILAVGCVKKTGLLTQYEFIEYSRMEYRSTQDGQAMIEPFRDVLNKVFYNNDGKRIKDSGIAKFTKSNELTTTFYPNVEFLNSVLAAPETLEDQAKKMLGNNYFFHDFTIAKFAKTFANELFDRYVPGLKWDTVKGRAEAFMKLEKMIGLKVDGKEYFLTDKFQKFIEGLKENKIIPIELPKDLAFTLKLKLKSKKATIKSYFKDKSDLSVIQRISTFNSKDARDDNFLIFEEYDISKHDAKAREIFDNIIGNRLGNNLDEANKTAIRDGAFQNINSIMYGRIELFQLDLIGVRK